MRDSLFLILTALLLGTAPARAEIKIHGFVDLIGAKSDTTMTIYGLNNRQDKIVTDTLSRIGLNLQAVDFAPNWDFATQILGRGSQKVASGEPNYILQADWLFLTYHASDRFKIKVGRQLYPIFLFSEPQDVGFTYLWTRLPSVVYSVVPINTMNGILAEYKQPLAGETDVSAGLYTGTIQSNIVSAGIGGANVYDNDIAGGYLNYNGTFVDASVTYKRSHPVGTIYAVLPNGSQTSIPFDTGVNDNYVANIKADYKNFGFILEGIESNSRGYAFEENGFYSTIYYNIESARLTPHATWGRNRVDYALSNYPDPVVAAAQGTGARNVANNQMILGLNYRVSAPIVLKADYQKDSLFYANSSLNFDVNTYTLALSAVF